MEFPYSSSSCSSFLKSEPHFIYDVFINFGGEDIRTRFISHLHSVLLQAQVKTLINEENMPEGMKLEEHMRAIAGNKISIIVFSKSYAESTCCLRELEKITECHETFGQIILTVFYEIDIFDVRHQKDDYGKALSMWSRALTSAVWDVRDFRHDAALVEVIVTHVQTLLDYQDLFTTQFPVGIDSHVEEVVKCIESQSTKVCMIGIWGMGGTGKTTIAKAIYNRIYREFIGKSFIGNIREVWDRVNKKKNVHLQEKLLYDVLKSKFEVESNLMGRTIIENELSRRKLLIVLDDVTEFGQFENLCGNGECFGQGTVIIITTRDVHVLNQLKVNYVYRMDGMNENDSLELFSCHAFGEGKPTKDFNKLARKTVTYCGGLPLALQVLGSLLCDSTMEEWESVLSKLKVIPIDEIQNNLKISFDGLSYEEKDIFLHVCCFFIGKERGYVTEILNACRPHANIGITVLIERGLIRVERNNKLQMHPLLHHMGKEIIRERFPKQPQKRSRLWFQDDVKDVLKKNTGTEATEGLSLELTTIDCFEAHAFRKMNRLRLLQLDNVQLNGDYGHLSKSLRWICWKRFSSKYIPNNFLMETVVALDLKHSHLQLLWKQSQHLHWLKFLNLSHSKYLIETPDFSTLPSLERLILKDCPSLCKLHPSIGDLSNLLLLNLKDCTSLRSLPIEVYKLKSLKTFILSGCFKIDISEEDIVQMESLITLVTENTVVKQVPCSVVSSESIAYISLRGFEGLSQNIFPSIIRSWMPPTTNPQSYFSPFCKDMKNNNWLDLAPLHSDLANIRSVFIQCDTAFQLSKQVTSILVEYGVNFPEPRISKHHLRFTLIGVGSYNEFFNTLSDSISEGLTNSESCDVSLPGDNNPYWLAHVGEGHSVSFTMAQNSEIKGMILCVVYLSTPGIVATECFRSVLIVNYTKCTLQIHKHSTVISFNNEKWHRIMSNLGSEDKVEIFVTFDHGVVVKNTAVYLICDESSDLKIKRCRDKGKYLK